MKIQKKLGGGGVWVGGGEGLVWGGGGVDVNEEIEVFVKIKKKNWGGESGGLGGGGQGGCKRRIEVFGKIHKKKIQGGRVKWRVGLVGGSGWM